MSEPSLGEDIISYIAEAALFHAKCSECDDHNCIIVWSSGAPGQIESLIGGRLKKKMPIEEVVDQVEGWMNYCHRMAVTPSIVIRDVRYGLAAHCRREKWEDGVQDE